MTNAPGDEQPYGSDTVLPFKADRSAVLEVHRSFSNLNRERLARIAEAMSPHQRAFIDVLPLMFHANHPMMPGYVDKRCPLGVCEYTPGERALRAATKIARSFSNGRRALRTLDIEALYLMGSTGTIAQSVRSDFDVWLCHREGLEADRLAMLQAKCEGISAWAKDLGMEVHFFLMQSEQFRTQGAEALSSESSGSTQHHLLLDEFYRTALHVAGKAPLWWLVPPEFEDDYDGFVHTLSRHRFVKPDEYLDFGPVANVSAAEFFGATLWQLSKAVSAPHKSLLKILLLEAYASDHPDVDLLSMRFKRAVYQGELSADALDPYVLLLGKVEDHLAALGDEDRLALARRSLYFKVNQPLSASATSRPDWRRHVVEGLARRWGWDEALLRVLDQRRHWKIDRTLKERQALVAALTRSYKSLSRFGREHAGDALISERDMTILGRKLFTAFEHKAGKVELVNHAISDDLSEPQITLQRVRPPDGQPYWLLFRGNQSSREANVTDAVKRGWSALELIAWAYFNGLLVSSTGVAVVARDERLDGRDTAAVNEHLHRHFPHSLTEAGTLEDFSHIPGLAASALFVNLGVDPLSSHTRKGHSITTSRGDALSFSGWQENLVQTIDLLIVSSWGEVLTFRYDGVAGLMSCLCEHLRWCARTPAEPVLPSCCEPRQGQTVTRRLGELFEDVARWFVDSGAERRRYVLRAGREYHVVLATGVVPSHEFSGSFSELLRHLGRPNAEFTQVCFDRSALDDPLVARVYDANVANEVQFYFRVSGRQAQVLATDEHGSLFVDRVPFHSQEALMHQFGQFFDAVGIRQSVSGTLPTVEPGASSASLTQALHELQASRGRGPRLRFYRVGRDGEGYTFEELEYARPGSPGSYFDVQVIGDTINGETIFTLYCNGEEFSTQEHGASVFDRVTEHIVAHRTGANRSYPVYITDIDLSRLPMEDGASGRLQTAHYLHHKRGIERRLNAALARHAEARRARGAG